MDTGSGPFKSKRAKVIYLSCLALCILAVVILSVRSVDLHKSVTCTIKDGNDTHVIEMKKYSAAAALEQCGYSQSGYRYTETAEGNSVTLEITHPSVICVKHDGSTSFLNVYGGTVANALSSLDINLDTDDIVSCELDDAISDGMTITVKRIDVEYNTIEHEIEFDTQYVANAELYEGTTNVLSDGSEGMTVTVYKSVTVDGVLDSFSEMTEITTKDPETRVVEYGTKVKEAPKPASAGTAKSSGSKTTSKTNTPDSAKKETSQSTKTTKTDTGKKDSGSKGSSYTSGSTSTISEGTITTAGGKTYSYSKVVSMTATAYTYSSNPAYNTTASGVPVQKGVVAVNPKYIPQGTKVYIVSSHGTWEYGYATVGDTGPKREIVDLFMDSESECRDFGVRDALVYILE